MSEEYYRQEKQKAYAKAYYIAHKAEIKERKRLYFQANKARLHAEKKEREKVCPRIYSQIQIEELIKLFAEKAERQAAKRKAYCKAYYQAHKAKILKQSRENAKRKADERRAIRLEAAKIKAAELKAAELKAAREFRATVKRYKAKYARYSYEASERRRLARLKIRMNPNWWLQKNDLTNQQQAV